jgi:hypothetical protein
MTEHKYIGEEMLPVRNHYSDRESTTCGGGHREKWRSAEIRAGLSVNNRYSLNFEQERSCTCGEEESDQDGAPWESDRL